MEQEPSTEARGAGGEDTSTAFPGAEDWTRWTLRRARRAAVAVVGGTVLLLGAALLVLPGPAFLVIPIGLGILGLEFAWARRWLRKVRERAQSAIGAAGGTPSSDER